MAQLHTLCGPFAPRSRARRLDDLPFREQLTRARVLSKLFARFDAALAARSFLAVGGQIVDAILVEARRSRLTKDKKSSLRGGTTPASWSKARHRQIDRNGCWTLKRGHKLKPSPEGAPCQAMSRTRPATTAVSLVPC